MYVAACGMPPRAPGIVAPRPDAVVRQVLKAADLYQLDHLKRLCERRIERYTDAGNCTYLFQVADKFKALELRDFCLDFIVRHAHDLRTTSEFETLSPELLSEITRALGSR